MPAVPLCVLVWPSVGGSAIDWPEALHAAWRFGFSPPFVRPLHFFQCFHAS